MRLRVIVTGLLLSCGLATPARADPAGALELARQATQHSVQGDHAGAIRLLERAYEADPAEDYLLQLAEEYETLGKVQPDPRNLRLAIAYYRQALAVEHNPAEQRSIQGHLGSLREQLVIARAAPIQKSEPSAPAPALPPEPRTVEISFVAENASDTFMVTVGMHTCSTPCSLKLVPGPYLMSTHGADTWNVNLLVPDSDGIVRIPSSRHAYLAPGVVLTVLGPIIAASFWAFSLDCQNANGESCGLANLSVWPIVGGSMFVTGIVLLAYRGARTPDRIDVETFGAQPGATFHLTGVGLQPVRNGVSGGLTFNF